MRIGVMASRDVAAAIAACSAVSPSAGASQRLRRCRRDIKILPLGAIGRTYGDRLLAIGDAAGLVKPTTGGGIHYSIVSAALAADVRSARWRRIVWTRRRCRRTRRAWRAELADEFEAQHELREVVDDAERRGDRQLLRAGAHRRHHADRPRDRALQPASAADSRALQASAGASHSLPRDDRVSRDIRGAEPTGRRHTVTIPADTHPVGDRHGRVPPLSHPVRVLLAAALIAGAVLRIAILPIGVPAVDDSWRAWSFNGATSGPWNLYGPRGHVVTFAGIDAPVVYPPLALDELAVIGRAHLTLHGGHFENDLALTRTIKGAIVLLDMVFSGASVRNR